jgi:hypothetical protein
MGSLGAETGNSVIFDDHDKRAAQRKLDATSALSENL